MLTFTKVVAALAATAALISLPVHGRQMRKKDIHARQLEAAKRFQATAPIRRQAVQNITFSNPAASKFFVDGKSIPEVDFDVGPSWSGLLPISGNKSETRQLFFWFFPPGPQGSSEDLIFWTNGGPGCSSMEGLVQENGPFSWSTGTAKPIQNQFSWTNLSSVLWVEQPVGTGFSQGTPNIKNEDDVAAQLVGFLQQFLIVFPEMKNKKLYLTGESYAGTYVPSSLSFDVVQEQIPAVNFVKKYENVFSFNQSFMTELEQINAKCNYTGYSDKFLTYPPKGLLPLPNGSTRTPKGCDVWDTIFNAALTINPAFNIYRIFDTFPILWDVLGFPGSFEQEQTPLYFNRTDVKKAIHAPLNVDWKECSDIDVFPKGDASLPPAFTVLPNVIEKSNRTVIVHGLADFILIAEGMTWNGLQGFQKPIANDSFLVDGVGALGTTHTERGLTYFEVELSGHMVPQYSPKAAFQIMQYLMGFRETP
ncbi:hypothetical protein CVT25_009134 [Psilocybe cyanescens]|uniref:Carboxypeptidase n=1 Tax=Psilocybe cyanescens TaxID=93625 RepID=A0A409XDN5_PSICY|nr:hypothetical protein CVT25_009134 [Psilocybe cyanescens]